MGGDSQHSTFHTSHFERFFNALGSTLHHGWACSRDAASHHVMVSNVETLHHTLFSLPSTLPHAAHSRMALRGG